MDVDLKRIVYVNHSLKRVVMERVYKFPFTIPDSPAKTRVQLAHLSLISSLQLLETMETM